MTTPTTMTPEVEINAIPFRNAYENGVFCRVVTVLVFVLAMLVVFLIADHVKRETLS